jgi:hypothetical protein
LEIAVMKRFVAVAASLLVNLGLVVAFERSANEAVPLPNGEVTVTDLSIEGVPSLAQASILAGDSSRPIAL